MKGFTIRAMAYGCHAAIWLVVALTVAAEVAPAVKELLAGLSGHHWTSKGLAALLLFFATAFLSNRDREVEEPVAAVKGVLYSVLSGSLIILFFYLAHYFGMV